VPRQSAGERLAAIAAAATEAFGRAGYRGTRTADVAAKAGVSTGSLFNYVESKEALFHLVFLHGLGMLPEEPVALPLPTPAAGESVAMFERALGRVAVPRLRAALADSEPADVTGELRGIVEELYSLHEQYWRLFAVVERCANDLSELDTAWFGGVRSGYNSGLAKYLARRMASGHLRQMPDAMAAAKMVIESVAWFAWHRRQGRDSMLFDDQAARRTVVEFTCAALSPDYGQVGLAVESTAKLAGELRPPRIAVSH
jgi:AcrR family transcriptional regulator